MAMISSNLFSPMPNASAFSALSQGIFVPSLTGDIGFGSAFGPSTAGIPSWGVGDVLSLVEGPMTTLSQFWQMYAGGLGAALGMGSPGAAAPAPAAAETKAVAVAEAG